MEVAYTTGVQKYQYVSELAYRNDRIIGWRKLQFGRI